MADLDYFDRLFDSDSDESEFSGFSEFDSDIEVGDLSDDDIIPDDEAAGDTWTDDFSPLRFDEFNEQPGARLPDGFDVETATPIDYLWLLFSPQLLRTIVAHTNGYFAWKKAQPDIPTDLRWQDTTEEEMRAFLAINILMGINQLPNAEMFWSTNPFINNAGITNTMTCNRFQKLVQYFHVADRSTEPGRGEPGYDKLFKVRPVMESVSRTFQDIYTLNKEVSVDEAMIAFTGRLSFRQYMPAKPIKRGIKVWMLCDAKTAFLARFEVYLGRQNNQTEHGLGHNVVMRLVDHIYHSFRWVFFDNFFTGIPLMKQLLEKGLYACGTVRVNRKGFPSQLKKPAEVRQRGDFKIMQMGDTNLTATVWKDKRLVHHLSTLSDPTVILPAQRRCGANVLQLQSPHSVNVYNMYMGGVDLHDQYRAKYDVGRCSKKYWRYLFWFLLNCCIVNAFILYKLTSRRRIGKKRFTHLDFRLELVRELAGGFCKRKRAAPEGRGRDGLVEQINMGGHVMSRLSDKTKTCKYHTRYLKQRKETKFGVLLAVSTSVRMVASQDITTCESVMSNDFTCNDTF